MSHPASVFRIGIFLVCMALLGACGGGNASDESRSMSGETDPNAAGVAQYRETPEAVESGRRIFEEQVCTRCHKETGPPGIGPNLWDDQWIYGGDPDSIYATIMHGRPRGMSPYEGRLSAQEVWNIVAYLRSASRLR